MIYFSVPFVLLILFAVGGVLVLRRIQRRKAAAAAALDATPPTDKQIEQAIRTDIAPQHRPYGDGGVKVDGHGRTYAIATDGSVRRFAVAERMNGEMETVLVSKPGKAARKAAKKAKRVDRGLIVRPVPPAVSRATV